MKFAVAIIPFLALKSAMAIKAIGNDDGTPVGVNIECQGIDIEGLSPQRKVKLSEMLEKSYPADEGNEHFYITDAKTAYNVIARYDGDDDDDDYLPLTNLQGNDSEATPAPTVKRFFCEGCSIIDGDVSKQSCSKCVEGDDAYLSLLMSQESQSELEPTSTPSSAPTPKPTAAPTSVPTTTPTLAGTLEPTSAPTSAPVSGRKPFTCGGCSISEGEVSNPFCWRCIEGDDDDDDYFNSNVPRYRWSPTEGLIRYSSEYKEPTKAEPTRATGIAFNAVIKCDSCFDEDDDGSARNLIGMDTDTWAAELVIAMRESGDSVFESAESCAITTGPPTPAVAKKKNCLFRGCN